MIEQALPNYSARYPQKVYAYLWDALRNAKTIPEGDAVLVEWKREIEGGGVANTGVENLADPSASAYVKIAALKKRLDSYFRMGIDVSGAAEFEEGRKPGGPYSGSGMLSSPVSSFGSYAYLKSIVADYAEARAYWAQRVAAFAAAAAAEVAAVTADVADTVSALSEDVGSLADVLQRVSYYVDLPDNVRAYAESKIAEVKQNRAEDVARIRALADRLRVIEQSVDAGDLDAFTDEPAPAPAPVSPLVKAALVAGALFLVKEGA